MTTYYPKRNEKFYCEACREEFARAKAFEAETHAEPREVRWAPQGTALQGVVMELNDCAFPTLNRIVATDERSPRDGRFIEIVGHYNPRQEPSSLTVNNEKAVKWLLEGAQPTERVKKLLELSGAWGEFTSARAK